MAAIKSRKVHAITPGTVAECVVLVHNLDEKEAEGLIDRVQTEFALACADLNQLLGKRDQTEADARAERVKALMDQIDPPHKVISHGTADARETAPDPLPIPKAKKGRK